MPSTFTYEDGARREDLLDIITNIDPQETQLISGLGTSVAKDIFHQYSIDTLKSVGTNAYVEAADASYADRSDPTRLNNVCQIVRVGYDVSDTERSVNQAGFNDRYSYEGSKALKEWKNDAELALLRGSIVSGNSSTARQMRGLKNSLSLVTSRSGVSLLESGLNDYFQNCWNVGSMIDAVYSGMYIKRKISGFTAGATKNVETTDKRLVNAVDIYQADAAKNVKLFAHRYMTIANDVNYDVLGIEEDKIKTAYLRKPFTRELAKTGDSTKGEVVGEMTLEVRHYNAGFLAKAHL